jgi:hypothetical protein
MSLWSQGVEGDVFSDVCANAIGRFWPFSADHGYKACWSNPMQSVVRTNANDWSGRMQTGVQVECNFAEGITL